MANFCGKCGAPAGNAKFCLQCGNPLQAGQAAVAGGPAAYVAPGSASVGSTLPPPTARAKSGSGLKIILIIFLVLIGLGMAGIVGGYYYVKHRVHQKMVELKARTGIDIPDAIESAKSSKPSGERRDGCLLLNKEEAQHILGFALARVDGTLTGSQEEHCDYFADPSARVVAKGQMTAALNAMTSKASQTGDLSNVENFVKSMGASANNGSVPVLQITVYRGDGKMATGAFNLGNRLMGTKPESVVGPWDEAIFGPMYSTLTVRKGNNGVMIDLRQIAHGRAKGIALAKVIAPRL